MSCNNNNLYTPPPMPAAPPPTVWDGPGSAPDDVYMQRTAERTRQTQQPRGITERTTTTTESAPAGMPEIAGSPVDIPNGVTIPYQPGVLTASMQQSFARGIGRYVICELLLGTDQLVVREGILTAVGPSYFILYNDDTNTSTICDFYSLKFATFFERGTHSGDVDPRTERQVLARQHPCCNNCRRLPVTFESRNM